MSLGNWMEGDDPFAAQTEEQTKVAHKENKEAALIFAQKFLIFESHPVAKELLEFWTRQARYRKVAPSASATEFAYFAGWREFVEGIHLQVEFAKNGGQSPYKER